jgi:hypothetical protein
VVTGTSDENLKNNIITISNAVNIVKKLRGVEYDWKDNLSTVWVLLLKN